MLGRWLQLTGSWLQLSSHLCSFALSASALSVASVMSNDNRIDMLTEWRAG